MWVCLKGVRSPCMSVFWRLKLFVLSDCRVHKASKRAQNPRQLPASFAAFTLSPGMCVAQQAAQPGAGAFQLVVPVRLQVGELSSRAMREDA